MPKFCANLGFLFLDRFAASAKAGFATVEYSDPYTQKTLQLIDFWAVAACKFQHRLRLPQSLLRNN